MVAFKVMAISAFILIGLVFLYPIVSLIYSETKSKVCEKILDFMKYGVYGLLIFVAFLSIGFLFACSVIGTTSSPSHTYISGGHTDESNLATYNKALRKSGESYDHWYTRQHK